jgi:hypothetical protein
MSTDTFDPALYTSAPRMTLESGIALARALVTACPQSMPARIHKAAKKLADATDKAQEKLALRQKALGSVSEEDKRLIDQAGDASWGALRARMTAYSMLPAAEYPDAKRAGEIVTMLFGDQGLLFLTEAYPVQWATADTMLKRIDKEGLKADIDRIAGPEFLDNIKKRHDKYGTMVQSMLIKADQAQVDLGAEVRALGSAIVAYATKVCAHVEDDDASSIQEARAALQPIDLHREANTKKSAATSVAPAPEAPAAP